MLDAPNCDWDTGKEAALRIDSAGTIAYTRASARSSDGAQVRGKFLCAGGASPRRHPRNLPSLRMRPGDSPSADVVECDFETMLRERSVTRRCNC